MDERIALLTALVAGTAICTGVQADEAEPETANNLEPATVQAGQAGTGLFGGDRRDEAIIAGGVLLVAVVIIAGQSSSSPGHEVIAPPVTHAG